MNSLWRDSLSRAAALGRDIVAVTPTPLPVARMLRSGCSIGVGFLVLLLTGRADAALICAFFTNLLVFVDQAGPLSERLLVVGLGAGVSGAAGALGLVLAPYEPLVLGATFAMALVAGFVHGSLPGVEMIPRQALICFVAGAFLPVSGATAALAVGIGTACVLGGIVIDHVIRRGARGPSLAMLRAVISHASPAFSLAYGTTAVSGLALGGVWGETRPYWVTMTSLLVMQPSRRANLERVLQRFVGTIAGVVVAFAITVLTPVPARDAVIYGLALAMPFVWPVGFVRNYAAGVALTSTWVLLLLDLALPQQNMASALFSARLADTALGCALALIGSLFVGEVANANA